MRNYRAKLIEAFLKLGTTCGNARVSGEDCKVNFKALTQYYKDHTSEEFIEAVGDARLKASDGSNFGQVRKGCPR